MTSVYICRYSVLRNPYTKSGPDRESQSRVPIKTFDRKSNQKYVLSATEDLYIHTNPMSKCAASSTE